MASGEREDVVNEIALMTNLLQMQNHDTLYVKLCDRLDNLTSVEHLEKLCNSGLDREKIEKKIRARRKILATSQVYLYIALKKLQDPRLYGALEYMIEWNEQKLETFEKTIERREKE